MEMLKEAKTYELGEIVDGPVITTKKDKVFVDLSPVGTGIIYGREFLAARSILRNLMPGDNVSAKITSIQNDDGYIVLSLKEARKSQILEEIQESIEEKRSITVIPKEANRGGLIVDWNGLAGFIPASQLSSVHYPKVSSGDKEAILSGLKKLIGSPMSVRIISADIENDKLIMSEKDVSLGENSVNKDGTSTVKLESKAREYKEGNEIRGIVTSIVNFGVFVKLDEMTEGLVHLSEIDYEFVDDPNKFLSVGDNVDVKVIDVKDDKISLSIKALKDNPWSVVGSKYKENDVVSGVVIKYNDHGALVSIEAGVAGLVHISNYKDDIELKNSLNIGKTYNFKINTFEPENQKLVLIQEKG